MKNLITCIILCLVYSLHAQNSTCVYSPYLKQFPPPYSPGAVGNAIQNGNFESAQLTPWIGLPNATRVSIGNTAYMSNYSAKLSSKGQAAGDAFIEQNIMNLIPGNTYTMVCWMKSQSNNTSAYMHVRFNYPGGNYQVLTKPITVGTTWTKFGHTFTVPSSGQLLQTLIQVLVYRGQNTSVFVDNVELLIPPSGFTFLQNTVPQAPSGVFYEDFKGLQGESLSNSKWLVVRKSWGNSYTLNNNGVVPENLELVCNGGMRFHGHGDLYNGPIYGATTSLGNGKVRTGSCIATKAYFASGRYDVVAKLTPGMVNAFWTFHYIEDAAFQNGGIKNSEIDWEFPSNSVNGTKTNIVDGLSNAWGGLCNGESIGTAGVSHLVSTGITNATSTFHKYSIEWHTGGNGIQPALYWYIDDVLIKQELNSTYIPFRASRFWLGVWFGSLNWIAGGNNALMQFDDRFMEVKSVTITPFHEANDVYENESDPFIGYDFPAAYPLFTCSSAAAREQQTPPEKASERNLLQCYPNPVQDLLTVTFQDAQEIHKIALYDVFGKLHLHKTWTLDMPSLVDIPTMDLTAGIYILHVETASGQRFQKKIQRL